MTEISLQFAPKIMQPYISWYAAMIFYEIF